MNPFVFVRRDKNLSALMMLACVLGLLYNFAILPGFGPDEPRHLANVRLLLDEHRLPVILPGGADDAGAHPYHPPLYYLLLLPFYAVLRGLPEAGVYHLLRGVSLLLCLGALPLLFGVARRAFPDSERGAYLTVASIALLPMWGMTAGTINNDSAAFFMVALFLWLLCDFAARRDALSALILGLCMGLGALCKTTVLLCDSMALIACFFAQEGRMAWRSKMVWMRGFIVLGVTIVCVGWWHARSFRLYGTWTPLPPPAPWSHLPSPALGKFMTIMHPDFPATFGTVNWGLFYTLWSQRDWILQHQAPFSGSPPALQPAQLMIYRALLFVCALALAGHIRGRFPRPRVPESATHEDEDEAQTAQRVALWSSYAAFAATWLTVVEVALFLHQGWAEGGRYLLPCLFGFALFLSRGWSRLFGPRAFKLFSVVWSAALLSLNGVAIYWLLFYLNPTYGPK